MKQEIPEVYDGTVEIMSVARKLEIVQKLRFVAIIQTQMRLGLSLVVVDRILKNTSKFHLARYDLQLDHGSWQKKISMSLNRFQIRLNLSTMRSRSAEVDQVIFDDEDSKHALVVVPDNKTISAIGRIVVKRSLWRPFDWLPHRYQIC